MNEIRILQKPDTVSWDDIHEVLYKAHEKNRVAGFDMKTARMLGDELREHVGGGVCFVAMDGDKVVGTTSVAFRMGTHWYDKGMKEAHAMLTGILPAYQGVGIYEDLTVAKNKYIESSDADVVYAGTAESNKIILKYAARQGYVNVDYIASRGVNYYSVIFVKWLKLKPFTDKYCAKRFRKARFWTRFRYKPGKIERFRTIAFATRVIAKLKNMIKR